MVHSRGISMNAKRPVLVTTDGSSHSHRVLPHAALLAGALDTRVTLLHVLEKSEARGGAEAEPRATLGRLGGAGDGAGGGGYPRDVEADGRRLPGDGLTGARRDPARIAR